jgi:hypothetical protein
MNPAAPPSFPWVRAMAIVAGIVVAFALFWMLFTPWVTLWLSSQTFSYVVENIVDLSGLSPNLVKGVVLIAIIPFGWALAEILRFGVWDRVAAAFGRKPTRWVTKPIALTIMTGYAAAYFFVIFAVTRGQNFHHTAGGPQRWYAVTPEGVRFFDSPGFDPKYGLRLEPVTPELAVNLARAERGQTPARIVVSKFDDIEFFDALTGKPKVWYFRDSNGDIELYSQSGHHPAYGDELRPITRDLVSLVRQQFVSRATQAAAEHAAAAARDERAKADAAHAAAARQHEEEVSRYTNALPSKSVAVVLVNGGQLDQELGTTLASALGGTSALFKPAFVSSGKFDSAVNGDAAILRQLDLESRAVSIVLARGTTATAVSPVAGNDVYKGQTTLHVRVFLPQERFSSQSFVVVGNGSAFATDEAKKNAEADAVRQVAAKLKS